MEREMSTKAAEEFKKTTGSVYSHTTLDDGSLLTLTFYLDGRYEVAKCRDLIISTRSLGSAMERYEEAKAELCQKH